MKDFSQLLDSFNKTDIVFECEESLKESSIIPNDCDCGCASNDCNCSSDDCLCDQW